MNPNLFGTLRNSCVAALAVLAGALVFAPTVCAAATSYSVTNLVSDLPGVAAHQDTDLVNAWGIAFNPNGFVWVANNGTGTSTLYDGHGVKQSLTVSIPPGGGKPTGNPTGIVFSSSDNFQVSNGSANGPSRFIFATESGQIAGWAPNVNFTNALVAKTSTDGAIYKGLALGANGSEQRLYATDFHNGKIDVYDQGFHLTTAPGGFIDPNLPQGFAPFGIQNVNGDLYVTYAKQDADREDDVKGAGLGFVDVFDPNGHLINRVASEGVLDAPWGIALAPSGFGPFSNALLVGNFGDGTINAFDVKTHSFLGVLRNAQGDPLSIDGLWGLSFGNGINGQPIDTLFAAAGPSDEMHGLYARIDAVPEPSVGLLMLTGLLGGLAVVGHRRLRSRL